MNGRTTLQNVSLNYRRTTGGTECGRWSPPPPRTCETAARRRKTKPRVMSSQSSRTRDSRSFMLAAAGTSTRAKLPSTPLPSDQCSTQRPEGSEGSSMIYPHGPTHPLPLTCPFVVHLTHLALPLSCFFFLRASAASPSSCSKLSYSLSPSSGPARRRSTCKPTNRADKDQMNDNELDERPFSIV